MQDTEGAREKAKTKFDQAMEELERLLLQKEGESVRDTGIQGRSPGVGGKRALGKAVAKGGMLLKGKNPGNVCCSISLGARSGLLIVTPYSFISE